MLYLQILKYNYFLLNLVLNAVSFPIGEFKHCFLIFIYLFNYLFILISLRGLLIIQPHKILNGTQ